MESGLNQRDRAKSAASPIKSFVKTTKKILDRGCLLALVIIMMNCTYLRSSSRPGARWQTAGSPERDEKTPQNSPTPCHWQAPASTQKTKRKTRPAIRRSARWRVNFSTAEARTSNSPSSSTEVEPPEPDRAPDLIGAYGRRTSNTNHVPFTSFRIEWTSGASAPECGVAGGGDGCHVGRPATIWDLRSAA